ncbi:hypothetical protein A2U01_0006934 [Trifolium medium]|uniref:Uncharacterized protein n=1 Tax=Trifolium medium TaxID=97028 RepID=A0A392MF05_9FABA|nr:hypothetical protein [Trifolium medium]
MTSDIVSTSPILADPPAFEPLFETASVSIGKPPEAVFPSHFFRDPDHRKVPLWKILLIVEGATMEDSTHCHRSATGRCSSLLLVLSGDLSKDHPTLAVVAFTT